MDKTGQRPIPDGRMRLTGFLTAAQKQALMRLKVEGLIMLNQREVDFTQTETWLEYWFDRNTISESDLRLYIHEAITNSK